MGFGRKVLKSNYYISIKTQLRVYEGFGGVIKEFEDYLHSGKTCPYLSISPFFYDSAVEALQDFKKFCSLHFASNRTIEAKLVQCEYKVTPLPVSHG